MSDIIWEEAKKKDQAFIKAKWGIHYWNFSPNQALLSCIDRDESEKFTVLEIGCDKGCNLLGLKNRYPYAGLYGVEINEHAASIASYIAQVEIANIEDKTLEYEEKFDYILFGDVLEHLHDPESVLAYCKGLLKEEGRIVASIPNIMHYSVMRQLLDGDFTYQDAGLLDKTHIHFFTQKEIIKMFHRAGYCMEKISSTFVRTSEQDEAFVENLLTFSPKSTKSMFLTYQYLVSARMKKGR